MHNRDKLRIKINTETVALSHSLHFREHFNSSDYAKKMYCLSKIKLFDSFTVLCVCTSKSGEYIDEILLNSENVLRPYIFASRIIEYASEKHGNNIMIAAGIDLLDNESYKEKFINNLYRLRTSLALEGFRLTHLIISDKDKVHFSMDEKTYL